MKKMLAMLLSFVMVFAFAGCSAEPSTPSELPESSESSISSEPIKCDVFKDINEKSKQFTCLNIDFDSIKLTDETKFDYITISAETENILISVKHDREEYNNSEKPKVLSVIVHSKKDVLSDEEKKEFFDVCKSILLIDEWGLTLDDLKDLNEEYVSHIKMADGDELSVYIDYVPSPYPIIDISTKEIWNYYTTSIVCPNASGEYVSATAWNKLWKSYIIDLNITYGAAAGMSKHNPHGIPISIDFTAHCLRHPYVKHTTKNKSLQKQKSQAINRF